MFRLADKAWLLCGSGSFAVSQALIVVALAQFAGGVKAVGTYGVMASVVAVLRSASEMGLGQFAASEADLAWHYQSYWLVRSCALAFVFVSGLAACIWFARDMAEVGLACGVLLLKLSESASDLSYGIFQRVSNARIQAYAMLGRAAAVSASVCFVAFITSSGAATILAAAGIAWVWFATFDRVQASRVVGQAGGARTNKNGWKGARGLISVAWPIGAAGLFSSVASAAPRILLELFLGRAAVGVWTAAYTIGQAFGLVNQAMLASVAGRLGRVYASSPGSAIFAGELARVIVAQLGMMALVLPAAYFAAPAVMAFAYGQDFVVSGVLLALILCSVIFNSIKGYLKFGLIVQRDSLSLVVLGAFSAATSIALLSVLVPIFGLDGAGWSILLLSASSFALTGVMFVRCSTTRLRRV